MINPNDKVILAFSGGISSTSLLYNLYKIQQKVYRENSIIALTIDNGLEPELLRRMNDFCEKYLIEQITISSEKIEKNYNKFNKNGVKIRYDFIRELINYSSDQLGKDTAFNVLCLGINLTDIAEICGKFDTGVDFIGAIPRDTRWVVVGIGIMGIGRFRLVLVIRVNAKCPDPPFHA